MRILPLVLLTLACTDKATDAVTDDTGDPPNTADRDGDGWPDADDCAPDNPSINPGVIERCDGQDNDCDDGVDEGVTDTYYRDADADGFGDDGDVAAACETPEGYSVVGNDCDDDDPDAWPGNEEACDAADNDCDGDVDEGVGATWYVDYDGDGFEDPEAPVTDCTQPVGTVADDTDCDDGAAAVYPGAAEACDGVDEDCDARVDEGASDVRAWYRDVDADGYGDAFNTVTDCSPPSGYVGDDTDCDDRDADVFPGGTETCDQDDEDCDGVVDEGEAQGAPTWYADDDADGYGDPDDDAVACAAPSGYVADDTDCDDADGAVNPGETEVCNGVDDDCDGDVDDDDASLDASTTSRWYDDVDGDGYGDSAALTRSCDQPSGAVRDATDCDDADSGINPGASETCDGVDEDCDGVADNGVLGTGLACPAVDCAEVLADNSNAGDGSYYLDIGSAITTYHCDMSTDGGGWTRVRDNAPVYGTGWDGSYYNTEGFTWDEVLFAYDSGSAYAHCLYPNDMIGCVNLGFQFGGNDWGVPLNFNSTICGLSTIDYSSATSYIGGYDFTVARGSSSDTIRLATLEGYTNCTTNDNYGTAYVDVLVRR